MIGVWAAWLLNLYSWIVIGRLVLEYVQMFSRDWRPRGAMLMVAEVLYTLTDPPLRFLRRVLPPLRLGTVQLDMSYLVLLLGISVLSRLVLRLG